MVKRKEMSVLYIFILSSIVHFCQGSLSGTKHKISKLTVNKPEPFTTIFLDDEAYSLETVAKKLKTEPTNMPHKEKLKISGGQILKEDSQNPVENNLKDRESTHTTKKTKPKLLARDAESVPVDSKRYKHFQKLQNSKKLSHQKRSHDVRKKLHRRNFDPKTDNVLNFRETGQINYQTLNNNNPVVVPDKTVYPLVFNPVDLTTMTWNSDIKLTRNFPDVPVTNKIVQNDASSSNYFPKNSDGSIWEQGDNYRVYRPDKLPQSSITGSLKSNNAVPSWTGGEKYREKKDNTTFADSYYTQNGIPITYFPPLGAMRPGIITTVPSLYPELHSQGNIVQRNISANSQKPKSDEEMLEDQLRTNEGELEDTTIHFDESCDEIVNDTCWMTREVGDVVTLCAQINSSNNPSSFQVRWLKVYHVYDSKKGRPLEIEPGKLAWNMVSGSEGRELRLNPVTNSDTDPNCIVAKVFSLTRERGKVLYTFMKRLIFRIDIPIIDMGKLYSGEELSINLENFISLPARGNMLFDWKLETKPHEIRSLPSYVKVSPSGRSVILKELKKGTLGVLNCVIYSSNRYALAKRRFNILNIESVKRRSTSNYARDDKLASLRSSRRCRRFIRWSREKAMQRLEEGTKPKSRKKRFRRMESRISELDCEPLRKKIYSRWIRSLFGLYTTSDPRIMPLDKLFELSEEGDGTLDDVIPHEIHYVQPEVRVVSGTTGERSIGQLHTGQNCTSNADCDSNAFCTTPQNQLNASDPAGHCLCRPEFYGDGVTCRKIPASNHREKRLRRDAREDFAVPKHLFYEQIRNLPATTIGVETRGQQYRSADVPVKILSFDEEESFLLSECLDDKDCNAHASCVQPTNGHPYCNCQSGYRGNGIFCWEIVDYVPPEEIFLPEEDINLRAHTIFPTAVDMEVD